MRQITYSTPNGTSHVVVTASRIRVDFDWCEEDACCDCHPDLDATRANGFKELVWVCDECQGGSAPLTISEDLDYE